MPNLRSRLANELADNYSQIAITIGEYLITNSGSLSDDEKKELKKQYNSIMEISNKLFTLSATLVLEEIKEPLDSLGDITKKIKKDYKLLQNIQKAINVAAAAVKVGNALLKNDLPATADAITKLAKTWNE